MVFHLRADNSPTLNAALVALWFSRGSRPVLLKNVYYCDFPSGVLTTSPPTSSGSAHMGKIVRRGVKPDLKHVRNWPGLEVIKLEFILRLKIKRNDWLLADKCPQAANHCHQGSKNPLVRSYLRVPQAAGQVQFWIISNVNYILSIYVNNFCDAGQVPILRYFKAWPFILSLRLYSKFITSRPVAH